MENPYGNRVKEILQSLLRGVTRVQRSLRHELSLAQYQEVPESRRRAQYGACLFV
jgi:hypothetical protein